MGHILVPLVKICFFAIKSERIEWNFACVTFSLLTFSRKPQPTFVCTFQNTIKAFVKCSKLCRECANIVLYWSVQHRSYCWKIITTFEKWHLIVINPRDDGTHLNINVFDIILATWHCVFLWHFLKNLFSFLQTFCTRQYWAGHWSKSWDKSWNVSGSVSGRRALQPGAAPPFKKLVWNFEMSKCSFIKYYQQKNTFLEFFRV